MEPISSSISIIIPVFNSAITLCELVQRVGAVCAGHSIAHEIVLVDDGSADTSWAEIEAIAAQNPAVAGIKLARNMGQNAAVIMGLQQARLPLAITMDDDMQHMPEHIPAMLAALTPTTGIVYAGPTQSPKGMVHGLLTMAVKYSLALICSAPLLRHMQTYRLLRTGLCQWESLPTTRAITLEGVFATFHPRTVWLPVEYRPRAVGVSTYTSATLALLSLNIMRYALLQKLPPAPQAAIAATTGWLR